MRRLAALALLLLLVPAADAQVREGLSELNVSASLQIADGGTSFTANGFYGYFVTPAIEVGPQLSLIAGEGFTFGQLGGFASYHFGQRGSTSVPFVGGEVGVGFGDNEGVVFGASAGVKLFVAPGAALVPRARILTDGDNVVGGAEFGVSIFF